MDSPSERRVDSRNITTDDAAFPVNFTNDLQEDLFSASSIIIDEQIIEAVQNDRPESEITLSPLTPQATTDETYDSSLNYSLPLSVYDDLMERLCIDNDILLQLGENTFNEQIPLDDISLEVLKAVERLDNQKLAHSETHVTNTTSHHLASNSLDQVNTSNPPARVVVSETSTQFQPQSFTTMPPYSSVSVGASARTFAASANVGASTTFRLENAVPQVPLQIGTSLGNCVFPNAMGNPFPQFQSCSSLTLPVFPHARSSSCSYQQFPRYLPFQMLGIGPQGLPVAMVPQNNQGNIWLPPPLLMDFPNFVHAWEGSLVGRIHRYRQFLSQTMVLRKPTSALTLTADWSPRLEIIIFLPTNAVNYTMQICGGPIDYVFFHIVHDHFNNFDLYDHLITKNMCAKIELASQTIILSATHSRRHFLGAIFSKEIIFVEPVV